MPGEPWCGDARTGSDSPQSRPAGLGRGEGDAGPEGSRAGGGTRTE